MKSSLGNAEPSPSRRRIWKCVVSVLVTVHVLAVFAFPFEFVTNTTGRPSEVSRAVTRVLDPYIDIMNLRNGYAFFAPEPGPSHLVRYRIEFDDGRPPLEQTFPDRNRHWPRLLYHRHFMLSEQLNAAYVSPVPPEGIDDRGKEAYRKAREAYVARWNAFERHLLHRYGGDSISMVRVRHEFPPPETELLPFDLTDPESYITLPEAPPVEAAMPVPRPGAVPPLRPQPPLESPPPRRAPRQDTPLESPPLEELP